MRYFSGTVSHQLDGKNRIRIPAKFRTDLGSEFYFMAGAQGSIYVLPKEALEERLEALRSVKSSDPVKMQAKRKIQSSVEKVTEDEQNRTLLSAFLREHAHIQKDIVTIGMGDYLEIWAKERFEAYSAQMSYDDAYALVDF